MGGVVKEQLFRDLYKGVLDRDGYTDKIPSDIVHTVFDNGYVNSITAERDMMAKMLFGDDYYAVEWFLYEWKPGYAVGVGDTTKEIYNIDEYIDWIKKYEGFK